MHETPTEERHGLQDKCKTVILYFTYQIILYGVTL